MQKWIIEHHKLNKIIIWYYQDSSSAVKTLDNLVKRAWNRQVYVLFFSVNRKK